MRAYERRRQPGRCGEHSHHHSTGDDVDKGGPLPRPARHPHPIGDIPLEQAALIEPLAVGHHAFVRSGARRGDTAFIGGAGPIGLLLAAVLTAEGVTVILSEPGAARQAKAPVVAPA